MKLPTLHHASYFNGTIVYSPSKVKYDKPLKSFKAPQWLADLIAREQSAAYNRGYAERAAKIREALGASARIGNMPR